MLGSYATTPVNPVDDIVIGTGAGAFKASQTMTGLAIANVAKFGAMGDGSTNDTQSIQNAIQSIPQGGVLYIPFQNQGVYMVDPTVSINLVSNLHVVIDPNVTIQAITNSAQTYNILNLSGISNVTISGGTIKGDRATHTGTTGEWGMGINIVGSSNIVVSNVYVRDCWGDGIYIGDTAQQAYCDNVTLEDVVCDNNRRNGISIISGRHIKVVRPKLINTNGTNPQAGIDLEPDAATDLMQHITIIEPYTYNNKGAGVLIALHALNATSTPIDIDVVGHRDDGSGYGVEIAQAAGVLGQITVDHPSAVGNYYNGILVQAYDATAARVNIKSPFVLNPNGQDQTSGMYGAGILVFRDTTDSGTTPCGNVHIERPTVKDTRATQLMTTAIYVGDNKAGAQQMQNCSVIDPLELSATTAPTKWWFNVANGVLSDKYQQSVIDIGNTAQGVYASGYKSLHHNGSSTAANTIALDAGIPIGWELTFEVRTANQMTITPDAGSWIRPLGSAVAKGVYSSTIGSRLTLKRLNSTTWFIKEQIGTWTSQ